MKILTAQLAIASKDRKQELARKQKTCKRKIKLADIKDLGNMDTSEDNSYKQESRVGNSKQEKIHEED